jgi:hypothetical protein
MTIERTPEETIIRIPSSMMKASEVQDLLDFLFYQYTIKESKASQQDADKLALLAKKGWWAANKNRFLPNEESHS